MRYFYSFIISIGLLISSSTYAFGVFADALFWQATEVVDWALNNNLNPTQQDVTYLTNTFDVKPGFRVGVNYEGEWDTKFYYTQYFTNTQDVATGNLTSAFLGAKSIEKKYGDFFFSSGDAQQNIHLNMFDWDLGKHFQMDEWLKVRPIIGVKGGWIHQTITTNFTGFTSVSEESQNDFNGIGPKAALECLFTLYNKNTLQLNILANFSSAYLWGNWSISDTLHDSLNQLYIVETPDRNVGALVFETAIGASIEYKKFSIKLSYEFNDWLDQYQVFDDGTGAHNNDLVLQGVALGLAYQF